MDAAVETPKPEKNMTSKFIRGSALLFVGRIIAIALKFVIQIMVVRYLTKSDFGAFSYALNMADIGQILCLLALDRTASRFIPIYDEHKDYDSLMGFMVLSLMTIIGLGAAMVLLFVTAGELFIGTFIDDFLSLSLLIILIATAPLQALDSWFQNVFAAYARPRSIFFRRYILLPLLQLVTIVLAILAQSTVQWIAVGYLVGALIGTVVYSRMFISLMRQKGILEHLHWHSMKLNAGSTFGFTIPFFLSGFVFIIRSQIIVVCLGAFIGVIAVAEYRAVQPIVGLNSIVYDSFLFLYLPLASRLFAKNDSAGVNELYWRTTAWISIATFPVFLVTFALAQPLVTLLFGEQYANSGVIMAIMAFGAYFNAATGFNKDTLRAYSKVKYLMFVDIFVLVVAVISYLIFIPPFGAVGGALAFTAAIIVNNILYHIGLMRFTGSAVFDFSYMRVYVMIIAGTLALLLIQSVFSPPLFVTLPIAALISLAVLRANAAKLQVGEMFPELLKVPLVKRLVQ